MKIVNKKICFIILGIVFVLGLYFLKCKAKIDIFETWTLSKYLPFKYLKKIADTPVNTATKVGYLLEDSFDHPIVSRMRWMNFWARQRHLVSLKHVDYEKQTCLFVKSDSDQDWAYQHSKIFSVQEGDVFVFKGSVKVLSDFDNTVSFRVITYDKNNHVLDWNYGKKQAVGKDKWVAIHNTIVIEAGTHFIRFGVTGSGKGKVWIDEVSLEKMPLSF